MLQDDVIRVFRTPATKLHGLAGGSGDTVYACWRSSGRRTRLLRESANNEESLQLDSVAQPARYGSPMIGFTTTLITRSGVTDSITSLNVRAGHVMHSNAGDVRTYELAETDLSIEEYLVTPAGSLAWIGQGGCRGSTDPVNNPITGVYVIDAHRRERAEQCGVPGADLGSDSGPAEFAGLRYVIDSARLSWLSRTGLETATLH